MKLHPNEAASHHGDPIASCHPSSLASRRVDISDAPRMLAFAHNVPLSMCTPAPRASPLSEPLQGKMILAPLTRGGNLPFRRLCVDYGMEVSFGEMVYARNLLKEAQRGRNGPEQARLRRAPNEQFFGVQIATNDIEEGLAAAKIVAESGADFIDLNCGCPIYEATRRNLGSALLRNPERLASLVEGLAGGSSLPVSVKVRLAAMGGEVNINEVAGALYEPARQR
jgi:tRNA-dihydrouridine synthase 3